MTRALLALSVLAYSLCGCKHFPVARLPGGAEFVLSGPLEDAFRAITFHGTTAITLSDTITIYGTGTPPDAQTKCHEEVHRKDASRIADALIDIEAIDDTPRARMLAWISTYGVEYLNHGYGANRFEVRARAACPNPLAPPQ